MNIIQQQERLKRLPEEAVVEYIANPTGEIPTFLAMGEIERRKVMRNKYAAQQAEQPPVSEQIVQESMAARMPQAMPQPPMPQAMPQPPMPSSGDAGITALPTPNVGQNYAQGGVVGYAKGGELSIADIQALREAGYDIPIGSTIDPRLSEAARLTALDEKFGRRDSPGLLAELGRKAMGTDISQLKRRILNKADRKDFGMLPVGVGPYDREAVPIGITELLASGAEPSSDSLTDFALVTGNVINKYLREPGDPTIQSLQKQPLTEEEIQAKLNEQDLKNLDKEQADQVSTIQKRDDARLEKELENIAKTGTNVADNAGTNVAGGNAGGNAGGDAGGNAPILTEKDINDIRLQKQQNYYDGIKAEQAALADVFGLQSSKDFYEAEREAMQAERDKYAGDKDSALNMALINAGLGIAGGTSSNALENIASGAQTGVASYTKDLKDIRDEDRLFNKELRSLDRLRRAEGRADLTEYKANELALRKLLQDSGLTTAEYATIMKDARAGASVTIGDIYKNGIKDAPGDTLKQKETNYYKVLDNLTKNRFKEMINAKVMPSVSIGDTTGFTARLIN